MFTFVPSKGIIISLSNNDKEQLSSLDKIQNAINEKHMAYDVFYDNKVIGFILLKRYENNFFLWDFAVDSNYQNKGFGTKILNELIVKLKKDFGAMVISTTYKFGNERAKHIYEKLGFKQVDVVLADKVHEVNMILNLENDKNR